MREIILNISQRIGSVDSESVNDIFDRYKIFDEHGSMEVNTLLNRLLREQSILAQGFNKDLPDLESFLDGRDFCSMFDVTSREMSVVREFRRALEREFSIEKFDFEFRVLNPNRVKAKFQANGVRALFDIIGFRIVPKNPKEFTSLVEYFQRIDADMLFSLNTFLYNEQEFARLIGGNSSLFYRAIHYYIRIAGFFVEVQLRTHSIDIWSKVHHSVLYKPVIDISEQERLLVLEFGRIANIVDFSSMLQ